jgi:hypothetical protein
MFMIMESVADEIVRQLGGANKLKAMIGAKQFYSDNDGNTLVFKFPNPRGPNLVKITLNGMDTYDIEFWRGTKKVKEMSNIYNDQLMDVFEKETGLYLTFSSRG